ncbi:MAG TPA: FapA family protein [Chitinispirillaceae bacterium]|nr:FapA family protein [Chitinispirillaceae bacterium]
MKNPLEQFFAVEDRADGVYLKVSRLERDSTDINVVCRVLEQSTIMNLDLIRIKDVIQRARGAFEKIGPLFECFDTDLEKYLQLSITPQSAAIRINSACIAAGKIPNEKMLRYYLNRNKVIFGVDYQKICEALNQNNFDKKNEIATWVAPKKGGDARIDLKIDLGKDVRPQVRENGSVDYREIHTFISIASGNVIAEKIPAQPGKPGTSVTGEPIAAEPGNDVSFPGGRNTEISQDGRYLIASKTGILFQEGGLFHLKELLQIESDVNFSVGNIKYSGDVLISGNVFPGFTVEADGNVHIKGELEASRVISRNGHVIIEKGIIGKNNTSVSGKCGIQVGFAQDAHLVTDGALVVEKFLMHCECVCKSLEISGANSAVVGCRIDAEVQMVIRNVGNEQDSSSRLHLFDKTKLAIAEKIKELEALESKLETELEPIQKQLRTKAALVKRAAGEEISERIRDEVKKWVDAYNTITNKIKYVKQKQEELGVELKKPVNNPGSIKIMGNVFPGTEIDLYGLKMVTDQVLVNKSFHLKENSILIQ